MATLPVPSTCSIVIKQSLFGVAIANVLHARKLTTAAFTDQELEDAAVYVESAWSSSVLPFLSNDLHEISVVATDISRYGGRQYEYSGNAGAAGGAVSQSAPGNVAIAIKFSTGHVGRSFRGRAFIGGIPASEIADNYLSGGAATSFVTGFEAIGSELTTGAGLVHVVVSRQFNKVPNVPPITYDVTNYSFADLKLDTMRSRLQ